MLLYALEVSKRWSDALHGRCSDKISGAVVRAFGFVGERLGVRLSLLFVLELAAYD